MLKTLLATLMIASVFVGCGERGPEKWTAYIYPDKTNTKRSMELEGLYDTLDECRAAAKDKLKALDLLQRGDFQCGLHCKYHEGMKTEICEKMTK